jgi:hypothetical protein
VSFFFGNNTTHIQIKIVVPLFLFPLQRTGIYLVNEEKRKNKRNGREGQRRWVIGNSSIRGYHSLLRYRTDVGAWSR